MTPRAERPDTVTREFILARCTNVQTLDADTAKELAHRWDFLSESSVISERDSRVYRLIAEMRDLASRIVYKILFSLDKSTWGEDFPSAK